MRNVFPSQYMFARLTSGFFSIIFFAVSCCTFLYSHSWPHFFFLFSFFQQSTVNAKTRFEPWTSSIGSDRSAQLSHNHCPFEANVRHSDSSSAIWHRKRMYPNLKYIKVSNQFTELQALFYNRGLTQTTYTHTQAWTNHYVCKSVCSLTLKTSKPFIFIEILVLYPTLLIRNSTNCI